MLDAGRIYDKPVPWMMRMGLNGLRGLFHLFNLPVIRRLHPWMRVSNTEMYWIPVNRTLEKDDSVPLPYAVVERFIEESDIHVIMDFCGCRTAHQCSHFPTDVGCLMMGPDAKKIPPQWSRRVNRDEARAHLQRAVAAGLPPFICKARIDNYIFGVPDNGRLLTVCFCCDCCCVTDLLKHVPAHERAEIVHPLEGLKIRVDEAACTGCGTCAGHCVIDAISLDSGYAVITDLCRGCGRCISPCPEDAIRISLNNPDFVEQTVNKIKEYVEIK